MSKLRYNLMKEVKDNIPDNLSGFTLYDPLSINFSDYEFKGNESEYTLTEIDVARPDLVSNKIYSTVNYQDILFFINGLYDIDDFEIKTKLKVPKKEEIKQYIFENRKG